MSSYRAPGGTWTSRLTGAPPGQAGSWTVALRNADTQAVVIAAAPGAVEIDAPSGNYAFTFTLTTAAGVYEAEWIKGSTKVIDDETVEVLVGAALPFSATGSPYFTVAEARKLKPLDSASVYPDADIDATRQLAEQAIEDACGVAFVPRVQTETLSGDGTTSLLLTKPKVGQVTAVTVTTGGVPAAYSPAQLAALIPITPDGTIFNSVNWPQGNANISVTYQHGYATLPLRVKRAAMLLTKRWLVDGPFDERATAMSTEDGTFSLITPGVRGALFDLPEVNAVVEEYGGFRAGFA